uniref:Reverse transcriptase domain-containing protein n=1 Tax=Strigamia maritima TaxID=126957 RepID=T1IL84_STRMM
MPGSVRLASRISRAGWIHQDQYARVRTLGLKRRGWYAGVRWDLSCEGVSFMPVSSQDFEEGEFRKTISQLKKRKTAGPDGIINEFYRAMSGEARSIVLKIVNDIWHKEECPEEWRTGVIIPIFKAGETRDVCNYRGITLLNSLYKITTTMMAKRLQDWAKKENVITENQAGFRSGYGTRGLKDVYDLSHRLRL